MAAVKQDWHSRNSPKEEGATVSDILEIPPLLWSQFYHKIVPFLELGMGTGQTFVFKWSYRLLREVATKRYLGSEDRSTAHIFMQLANYFNGSLMKPKQTTSHESMQYILLMTHVCIVLLNLLFPLPSSKVSTSVSCC